MGIRGRLQDFTSIGWPKYLLRVKTLRLVSPEKWHSPGVRIPHVLRPTPQSVCLAAIGNTIYSLAAHLRQGHHESLSVETDFGSDASEGMKTVLYPLRLLGIGKSVILGTWVTHCILFDESAERTVRILRSRSLIAKAAFLHHCHRVLSGALIYTGDSRAWKLLSKMLYTFSMMIVGLEGIADPDTGQNCYNSARVYTNTIKYAVEELRALMELHDMSMQSESLQKHIQDLLHADIELRATPTHAKKGEDAHGNACGTQKHEPREVIVVSSSDGSELQ